MTLDIRSARKVYLCGECGYCIGPGALYAIRDGKDRLCRDCTKVELARRGRLPATAGVKRIPNPYLPNPASSSSANQKEIA